MSARAERPEFLKIVTNLDLILDKIFVIFSYENQQIFSLVHRFTGLRCDSCKRNYFREIAGTYVGWRARTTPAGTTLFKEVDQIRLDGSFHTFLIDENGNVQTTSDILTLDADGNITGPYEDPEIQGRNLIINYRLDSDNAVQVMAERMD